MRLPALLGLSNATTGAALAIAWALVLGAGLYQYRKGTRSLQRTYMVATMALFWFAFGLLQVANDVAGSVEVAVVAAAGVSFFGGIFAGVRWWRLRRATPDDGAGA